MKIVVIMQQIGRIEVGGVMIHGARTASYRLSSLPTTSALSLGGDQATLGRTWGQYGGLEW